MVKKQNFKHPFRSKTFWINFFSILAGFTLVVTGELQSGVTLTGAGLINLFLRFVTSKEIKF